MQTLNLFPSTPASGDNFTLTLQFTKADGSGPQDMTGLTIGVTVRSVPSPTSINDSDAVSFSNQAGGPTGNVVFMLGPFKAGEYFLDVKTFGTGTPPVRSGVVAPTKFQVVQSVTMRSSP